MSRSTVREALRLLASQNLIITTRGVTGGSFVAHPSADQLATVLNTGMSLMLSRGSLQHRDVVEVRGMIEVPATGYAAVRRTDSDLEAIRTALLTPRAGTVEQMIANHRRFHLAVLHAAANPLAELLAHAFYPMLTEGSVGFLGSVAFWDRVDTEHHEIVDAVAAGDAMSAQRAAGRHVAHVREAFEQAKPLVDVISGVNVMTLA